MVYFFLKSVMIGKNSAIVWHDNAVKTMNIKRRKLCSHRVLCNFAVPLVYSVSIGVILYNHHE